MFDRLTIAFSPLFTLAIFIGGLCGLVFAGLGVARMYDKIDMGREFEAIEPVWMIGGGVGITIGAFLGFLRFKSKVNAARNRLKKS